MQARSLKESSVSSSAVHTSKGRSIELRESVGKQVFTTCSSAAKRDFLLATFPKLKASHIGDSRSRAFEALVMRGTEGRGVDLCLNSLDQDKLQVGPIIHKIFSLYLV